MGGSVAVFRGVLSLPQYGTAECGHRELGFGAGAGHGDFVQSFIIHRFGDIFSPTIIGAISDRTKSLRMGLGATLIFLLVSGAILRVGARFAPPLEKTESNE